MTNTKGEAALQVARAYHAAWQRRDYEQAWQLLDDDLCVEVPINSYPTKSTFVEAARRTREMTTSVEPFAELGTNGQAVLIYDMALPVGTLRVAEHFTVESGRICRIVHVHDTAALRGTAVDQEQ